MAGNIFQKILYILTNKGIADPAKNGEYHLLKTLGKNSLLNSVFDVGANIGTYSAKILTLNNKSTITCFEPDTRAFIQLKNKFRSNKNVIVNNIALSNQFDQKTLYLHDKHSEYSSFHPPKFDLASYKTKALTATSLDKYCALHNINEIDLLKIDTEGHDYLVLLGAKDLLLRSRIKTIQFEFGNASKYAGVQLVDFFKLLNTYKMDLYQVTPKAIIKTNYSKKLEELTYSNFVAIKREWFREII